MDELHFDGDPATESTRRRLERIIKEQPRPRWPWFAAFAAGGAFAFWQVRRRRRNQNGSGNSDRQNDANTQQKARTG